MKYPPMKHTTFAFTDQQLMMAFAFLADIQSGRDIKSKVDGRGKSEEAAEDLIKSLFDPTENKVTAEIFEGWELVYGPAMSSAKHACENLTVIFYKRIKGKGGAKDTGHMVVAVAGTNFIDSFDWFNEDVSVRSLVPYNKTVMTNGKDNSGRAKSGAYISAGTATALQNTWNTKTHARKFKIFPGPEYTPIEWLKRNVNSSKYPTTKLSVTGHSLGGAIAPTLAVALYDNRKDWNGGKISIDAYVYAGPTPGDEAFRNYAQSVIGIHVIKNVCDIVPHAWQISDIEKMPKMFSPKLKKPTAKQPGAIVFWTIQSILAASQFASDQDHVYKQWVSNGDNVTVKKINTAKKLQDNQNITKKMLKGVILGFKIYAPSAIPNLYLITGIKKDKKDKSDKALHASLAFFLQFLDHLKYQHTDMYREIVFSNKAFETQFSSIFFNPPNPTLFDERKMAIVMGTMIADIAEYYRYAKGIND